MWIRATDGGLVNLQNACTISVATDYDAQGRWRSEHPEEQWPDFFLLNAWFGGETRAIAFAEGLTEKQANTLMMALQTQVLQAADISDDGELHIRPQKYPGEVGG